MILKVLMGLLEVLMGLLEAVTLTTWHFEGLNSISHLDSHPDSVKILLKHLSIARALNRQVNGRVVSKQTDLEVIRSGKSFM